MSLGSLAEASRTSALRPRALLLAVLLPAAVLLGCRPAPHSGAESRTDELTQWLETEIAAEMDQKELPAFGIALVDDQEIVWAGGFGSARGEGAEATPADAETVYRVGSVSKLFTDLAVMQLVERGELDLDASIAEYVPEIRPRNPFDESITLRELMCHRAGLVREPPVGHYFDPSEPTLEDTVASLSRTELLLEPGARTKYSNAGIALVGYVLQRVTGKPFPEAVREAVLEPLEMRSSDFVPRPGLAARLADAQMWTLDGRTFPAPTFQLGMAPAGSMYSTVTDLGRFLSSLFGGGGVVGDQTLAEMLRPQFAPASATSGYGLGFRIGELDGHRWAGHGGAIYGFATQLAFLPDEKLGVVAVTTVDFANGVTSRIADLALRGLLARRSGEPLPRLERSQPLAPREARRLAGRYTDGAEVLTAEARGERLFVQTGRFRREVRRAESGLVYDDRFGFAPAPRPTADGTALVLGDRRFLRADVDAIPGPPPERWRGLIGEYGWDHDVLFILEREGSLYALIEWFELDRLEELGPDRFAFPSEGGLYPRQTLQFERGPDDLAMRVSLDGVVFDRRPVGPGAGQTFRIEPQQPVDELRAAALAATPPEEAGSFRAPDLVELTSLDPTIRLDIRYATTNNFMGARFYEQPRAFLQRPAAEAVVRAHRALAEHGYGVLIHDGYRPWYVTKMFWDATPSEQKIFVADPASGSRHNRGCAVDLTLFDLASGRPVEMTGGYDEMTPRSFPDYPGGTARQRALRELLRSTMESEGFTVYEFEWWHFDYRDWREYAISNLRFEELGSGS